MAIFENIMIVSEENENSALSLLAAFINSRIVLFPSVIQGKTVATLRANRIIVSPVCERHDHSATKHHQSDQTSPVSHPRLLFSCISINQVCVLCLPKIGAAPCGDNFVPGAHPPPARVLPWPWTPGSSPAVSIHTPYRLLAKPCSHCCPACY